MRPRGHERIAMTQLEDEAAALEGQHGVQSVEVGVRVLKALAQAPRAQMLRDVAQAAAMAPAKAHRYLVSLARMGLVEQHAETGLYDLGPFALELGLAALARLDPVTAAAGVLAQLVGATGQTCALAVWANRGATIVRWLGADTPVAASLRVGSVLPLTRSATGGAFLAFLAREVTASLVRQELEEHARRGLEPHSLPQVERFIAATRRRGFAHTAEFIPGVAGIAAPVFDHTGAMVLALVALGYAKPFEAELAAIAAAVLDAARTLSARCGARA
jgi:DNA-binding IclR family transcriptional regulator